MSELSTWIIRTLGHDNWPKSIRDGETITHFPGQREYDIVAHYERELSRGRLTLPQAYERATADLQGRNGHASKPQRGKNYRAIQVHITRGEAQ